MLGQNGSTPLELFWDVIEQLDIDFRLKRDYVLDVLEVRLLRKVLTPRKNDTRSWSQRITMNSSP
jgi:hypothetical protein